MLDMGLGLAAVAASPHAVAVSELADGALDSGTHGIPLSPVWTLLFDTGLDLQVEELSRGKPYVPRAFAGGGALGAGRARLALALGEPRHDQRGRGGRGRGVGAPCRPLLTCWRGPPGPSAAGLSWQAENRVTSSVPSGTQCYFPPRSVTAHQLLSEPNFKITGRVKVRARCPTYGS